MTRQNIKIIVLVILGIIAVVMLFLAAFRFFKPERTPSSSLEEEKAAILEDPESTVYVSKDGGETWHGIAEARFTPLHFVFVPQKKRLLIGTEASGVWEIDTGELKRVQRGVAGIVLPEDAAIYDLASSQNQSVTYAAARYNEQGYLVSLEQPRHELFFSPLEDFPVRTVGTDPFVENHLFIGVGMTLFESRDNGNTWKSLYRFKQILRDIVIHPSVPGWFFVSTQRGEIFRTPDEGRTWENLTRGFSRIQGSRDNQRLYTDPLSGILYITADSGLIASEDDGSTWEEIPLIVPPDSLPIIGFAVHPTNHNILYVSASNQLYKSTDRGATWKGTRFPEKGNILAIAVNPADPAMLFLGFSTQLSSTRSRGILDFLRR